jgi:GntR family transcriptional regulator/MocR family aminotransferase
MPRDVSALDLPLTDRPAGRTLAQWLYEAPRTAILDWRLGRGARLPATRDLARQYGVARGTLVAVFEQFQSEAYVTSRVGSGTRVATRSPMISGSRSPRARPCANLRRHRGFRRPRPSARSTPSSRHWTSSRWSCGRGSPPADCDARRALLGRGDVRGYAPLREAIAASLGSSRGVRCIADQVVIVSGAQQALDLLARVLVRPGEPVWMAFDPSQIRAGVLRLADALAAAQDGRAGRGRQTSAASCHRKGARGMTRGPITPPAASHLLRSG